MGLTPHRSLEELKSGHHAHRFIQPKLRGQYLCGQGSRHAAVARELKHPGRRSGALEATGIPPSLAKATNNLTTNRLSNYDSNLMW